MMEFAVTVAGAVYLTKLLFALVYRIERPKRKAPCISPPRLRCKKPSTTP